MSEQDGHGGNSAGDNGGKTRLWDYAEILIRWRRFIAINFTVVVIFAVILSFLLPKWYKATASILPPKDQGLLNLFGATSSMLRGLSSLPRIGGFGQSPGVYNYFAILRSRSTMETVVRRFGLMSVYNIADSSMEKAIRELEGNTAFEMQDDEYVTIEVYDKDPRRAADIANSFVEILNERSISLGTQEARSNREYIEQRLELTRDSLRIAENALKDYQERSGMMITPEETSAISSVAELYGMKAKREIEAAILGRTVTGDNESLRRIRLELSEIDKKLSTIPQTALEAYRKYRDVAILQKILEVLVPLYEQAKINENKDVPVLLVLDRAVPAERKARPQRLLIVLSISFISFFFLITLVFAIHGVMKRSEVTSPFQRRLQRRIGRIASAYRVDMYE